MKAAAIGGHQLLLHANENPRLAAGLGSIEVDGHLRPGDDGRFMEWRSALNRQRLIWAAWRDGWAAGHATKMCGKARQSREALQKRQNVPLLLSG